MKNDKKFKEMLLGICERYEKEPPEMLTSMTWEALKSHDDAKCIAAFNHVFRYGRFFKDLLPDLLDFLEKDAREKADGLADIARVETTRILEHLEKYGTYKKPAFSDPITQYLMSVRWPFRKWGDELENKNIAWWTKEFIASYVAEAKQGRGKEKAIEAPVLSERGRQKNIQQTNDLVGGFLPGMRLKGVPEKKKKESQAQASPKPPGKKTPGKMKTCQKHGEYYSAGTVLPGSVLGGDDKCVWSGCPKCRDNFDRFLAAQEGRQGKKA